VHPLIARCHCLAIVASYKSLFLIFGNFEPICHWSRWVLSVVSVVENVHSRSLSSGSTTTVANRCPCQRLNFRSFELVLHPSRWVEAVVSVVENIHSRSLSSGSTAAIDNRHPCQRLNFRTFEPVLHLSRWVEEEKQLPLSLLWALESIYCQSRKDLFGSSLSGWIELNFATFEPVLHSSRSVWKRPIKAHFQWHHC